MNTKKNRPYVIGFCFGNKKENPMLPKIMITECYAYKWMLALTFCWMFSDQSGVYTNGHDIMTTLWSHHMDKPLLKIFGNPEYTLDTRQDEHIKI